MDRRNFLSNMSRSALAMLAAGQLSGANFAQAQKKRTGSARNRAPNIIFILADDLGYADLSCYGQKKFQTPNIDRIANEGVRFTQAYAGSTVCAPSRCSLMTGLHQGHARIRGNSGGGRDRFPLHTEDITVAEVLKKAGYATGMFGKWGLGQNDTTGQPNRKGFDEWFGYLDHTHAHFHYTDYLYRNTEKVSIDKRQYTPDLLAEAAQQFIRANKDKPFFLYLPYPVPHPGIEVPEDSLKEFRGKYPETPFESGKGGYNLQPTPHAGFAAMMTRMDRDIGRMMALLKELGIDDNTIVFFTSDNGPVKEGGADPAFFQNNGPLRGIKRDLYEGGIRVPMIARWPDHIKAGRTSDQAWAFWDVMPTLAALAGTSAPAGLDGISMVPALLKKGRQTQHEYFYWEFYEGGFQQAARMNDWKAVRLAPGKPLELYNLKNDLGEQHDVASANPQIVARMEQIIKTAHVKSPDFPLKKQSAAGA